MGLECWAGARLAPVNSDSLAFPGFIGLGWPALVVQQPRV